MNICTVNTRLSHAFELLGHRVLTLTPKSGPVSLPALLESAAFVPDLVFQQENLGRRALLTGLEDVPCPKIFWSVDTHLNYWWHGLYAQAFDLVMTTQDHLVQTMTALGSPQVVHLPWFGTDHPWTSWSKRDQDMLFVGRLTPTRPSRTNLLRHLDREFGCVHRDDVGPARVTGAYARARLAPNESILGEINFRLFEAASAGCAVLMPPVLGGVENLFVPGREVALFGDILELDDLAHRLRDNPRKAEAMGRAAWERIRTSHLAEHRARDVLKAARDLAHSTVTTENRQAQAKGILLAWEAGTVPCTPAQIENLAAFIGNDPWTQAFTIRTASGASDPGLPDMVRAMASARTAPASLEPDLACSMAALRLDMAREAEKFLARQGRAPVPEAKGPAALLSAWSDLLVDQGRSARFGFPFDPARHLPASALECLLMGLDLAPGDPAILNRLESISRDVPGLEHIRLGVLSRLTMDNPGNWRLDMELGLADLAAFRRRQGLAGLARARAEAVGQGQEDQFATAMADRDATGLAASFLNISPAPRPRS